MITSPRTLLRLGAALFAASLVAVPLLTPTASADPVIDRIETETRRGRQLRVEVHATTGGKATVELTGKVNDREFKLRRKVRKASSKVLRFTIDAKRLKLRKLREDLRFTELQARVVEKDGSDVTRALDDEQIPVPVVFLPGLGNENAPRAFDAFAAAVDTAAGGVYDSLGEKPRLVVHGYDSLTDSLPRHAKSLRKTVKKLLRGSSFKQVDVVGYSMGGLVARQFLADRKGRGKVRRLVMLGTPNQGAPIAYVGAGAVQQDLLGTLLAGEEFADLGLVDGLLTDDTLESLRVFYPTYTWAFTDGFFGRQPIPDALLSTLLGDPASPLRSLNAVGPDAGLEAVHSLAYTALPADEFTDLGTLDEVDIDIATLLAGNGLEDLDLTTLLTGAGDGIVPARSAFFQETPAWAAVTTTHDMGEGTHVTLPVDPLVIARVAELLTDRTGTDTPDEE